MDDLGDGMTRARRLVSTATRQKIQETMGFESLHESLWLSLQVFAAAGYHPDLPDLLVLRSLYFSMILGGLVVFAILVGFITEGVVSTLASGVEYGSRLSRRALPLAFLKGPRSDRVSPYFLFQKAFPSLSLSLSLFLYSSALLVAVAYQCAVVPCRFPPRRTEG